MPERQLLSEIRGRRLFQWTFAYVAAAWILIELTDFLVDMFDGPAVVVQAVLSAMAFGFLAALVVAWHHGEKGRQQVTRSEVAFLTAIAVVGLLVTGRVLSVGIIAGDEGGTAGGVPSVTRTALAETRIGDPREAELAIAVLPFLNLDPESGDAATAAGDAFSDGVTEDIIYELSLLPGLRVISRTSTARYRGSGLGVVEIGRELDVDLVLEGSARRVGNQARIVAQLIDARTDEHLWSGSWDRELENILQVQSEVADEIARALPAALGMEAGADRRTAGASWRGEVDPVAYEAFVQGRRLVRSGDPDRVEEGARLLASAVEQDPTLEPAFAAMAELLVPQVPGAPPQVEEAMAEALPRIRTFVRRTLDDASAAASGAQSRFAWRLVLDSGSPDEVEAALRQALARNPNDADARRWYGALLARDGRHEQALEQLRIARAVDPASAALEATTGTVYLMAGDEGAALLAFGRAAALAPDHAGIRVDQAVALGLAGRPTEGLRVLDALPDEADGRPQVLGARGFLLARSGARDEALGVLARLEAEPESRPGRTAGLALVHVGLGQLVEAREMAERLRDEPGWTPLTPALDRALDGAFPKS
jgi:TolB-like protein/Flp pilus assembly protein TadD